MNGDGLPEVQAVLMDLDGTLYEGDTPVEGAVEAVRLVRIANLPLRFVTNTTDRSRRALSERLWAMGIPAAPEEIHTAPVAAARWLRQRGIRRVALHLPEDAWEDFPAFELDAPEPEAVLVGHLGAAWSYNRMNRAFRQVLAGARLVAVQRDRFAMGTQGPVLDAGPFVAALEYAAGVEAELVGKPAAAFFRAVLSDLGLEGPEAVMVGDSVEGDVQGAKNAGLRGVLVRTGGFRPGDLDDPLDPAPDAVLESLAELPEWLGISE